MTPAIAVADALIHMLRRQSQACSPPLLSPFSTWQLGGSVDALFLASLSLSESFESANGESAKGYCHGESVQARRIEHAVSASAQAVSRSCSFSIQGS